MQIRLLILLFIVFSANILVAKNASFSVFSDSDSLKRVDTDTTTTKVVLDTLRPLNLFSFNKFSGYSTNFSRHEIEQNDYKYTGDLFSYIPFGFLQDLGYMGQPNEVMIYGQGFNNITYMQDGVPINNRITNSYNLYNLQIESMDSIEVYPLVKGFLGGSFNNPVSVNFITKSKYSARPYSRIRFYQGDLDEGYIDFLFHTYITKKIDVKFNLTNYSVEDKYQNSEYGNWQGFVSARYNLSNSINFMLSYNYSRIETRLNGGIDLSYLKTNYSEDVIESYFYDRYFAPVNYYDRYQKTYLNNFDFTIMLEVIKALPTNISFYTQNNLTEFRQNEQSLYTDVIPKVENNKYVLSGINVNQQVLIPYFTSMFWLNLERINYYADILKSNSKINSVSVSGLNKLAILKNITPSVFYKFSNYNNKTLFGFGSDIDINFKLFRIYGGFSAFQKPLNVLESDISFNLSEIQYVKNFEAGIKYKSEKINISSGYFISSNDKTPYAIIDNTNADIKSDDVLAYMEKGTTTHGINVNFSIHLWKILISNNSSVYFTKSDVDKKILPEYSLFGGIYYVDTLFNDNLKLKTGFNIRTVGKQDARIYNFNRSISAFYYFDESGNMQMYEDNYAKSSIQVDFFLAGKIQDAAIIYFVFQNVFNEENYYIPIYPKQDRGIRLGFSWELFD